MTVAVGQIYEPAFRGVAGRYTVIAIPKGCGIAKLVGNANASHREIGATLATLEDGRSWRLVGGPVRATRTRRTKRAQNPAIESAWIPGGGVRLLISMRTYGEPNLREHWGATHRRSAQQRRDVAWAWRAASVRDKWPAAFLPCTVTLTRIARRAIDGHDNLRAAFKHVVDQIAVEIGLPLKALAPGQATPVAEDGDERVTWTYGAQRIGTDAVEITVEPRRTP